MTPKEFIPWIAPLAQAAQKITGVPASVTIAQAALESGWGKHAPANNLFGIKADAAWKGERSIQTTTEYVGGKPEKKQQVFRKYKTLQDSITDHGLFLKQNKRYEKAFAAKDGIDFAHAIAKAGYATDPGYAELLETIILKHQLLKFDGVKS